MSIKSQIDEHKRALENNDLLYALTIHRNTFDHNFNFKEVKILYNSDNRKHRRCVEAAAILNYDTITQRCGYFNLNKHLSQNILRQHRIHDLQLNTAFTQLQPP